MSYTQPHRAQDHMWYSSALLQLYNAFTVCTQIISQFKQIAINSSEMIVTSPDFFVVLYCCYSYLSFFILGSSEAVPQLLSLSEKLFHKMVDTREPFHLTLLNVCFSNLQAKSSSKSSIASFFTQKSPTTSQMTSRQQVSTYDFPHFIILLFIISSNKT